MTTINNDNQGRLKRVKAPNGKVMTITPAAKDANIGELFGLWKEHPETKKSLRERVWPKH